MVLNQRLVAMGPIEIQVMKWENEGWGAPQTPKKTNLVMSAWGLDRCHRNCCIPLPAHLRPSPFAIIEGNQSY